MILFRGSTQWWLKTGVCFAGAVAAAKAHFGPGTGPIVLSNVECEGSEQRLEFCPHGGLGTHTCDHEEDAGVICQGMLLTMSTTFTMAAC